MAPELMHFADDVSAMRYGMEQGLRDLKWNELDAIVPGETMYNSPGDSIRFTMAINGTHWAFAYDDSQQHAEVTYVTFAEGDTWIEFERALLLAQAIEEDRVGAKQDLIGKWWDSFDRVGRRDWFRGHGVTGQSAVWSDCAWRALVGHERENIEREVLKGITK